MLRKNCSTRPEEGDEKAHAGQFEAVEVMGECVTLNRCLG